MRSRSLLSLLTLCLLLVSTVGCVCPMQKPRPKKHYHAVPPTVMGVDETRFFSFPPDGDWHSSGILVLNGDVFEIEPIGIAAGLEEGDLQYKVDKDGWPLYGFGNQPVKFESMGPLKFMGSCKDAKYICGMLEVRITKIAGGTSSFGKQLK